MTVLPEFGGRVTPMVETLATVSPVVRCDRCGKEVCIPLGPFYDKCNMHWYKEHLVRRNASEEGWLDQPALTDEYIINEFNKELWSHGDPHPMLREALEPLGFDMDGFHKRTVCSGCREALKPKWERYYNIQELLGLRLAYPIVWPWPEDDVPEPMDYQRGVESMESYMKRRTERRALKEQGKDPDLTPRYRLVYEADCPHFMSCNLRCKELSDDWKESVEMAEAFGPFRLRSVCFIADMVEMKRIPREEWH